MEKKIIKIIVQDVGVIFADYDPIERFDVNGEMAHVSWYRKGKREFNGKFVIEIQYD
jgi:hypothetical protein